MDRAMIASFLHRPGLLTVVAVAAGCSAVAAGAAEPPNAGAITCTNQNGYSWQIAIDYRAATVDANPARISRDEISWFDPKDGGNYTLDRRSGALTASVASSTGGYFRRARCNLERPR